MIGILWAILAIVLIVWLIGLLADFAGNLIHILLIVALAILIYNLVAGRRAIWSRPGGGSQRHFATTVRLALLSPRSPRV